MPILRLLPVTFSLRKTRIFFLLHKYDIYEIGEFRWPMDAHCRPKFHHFHADFRNIIWITGCNACLGNTGSYVFLEGFRLCSNHQSKQSKHSVIQVNKIGCQNLSSASKLFSASLFQKILDGFLCCWYNFICIPTVYITICQLRLISCSHVTTPKLKTISARY